MVRDATSLDRERATAEIEYAEALTLQGKPSREARREAITHHELALRFFDTSGDKYRAAMIRAAMGLVYARMGDMSSAVPLFERATGDFRALRDGRRESDSINNLAGALDVLGDLAKARAMYEEALKLARANGDKRGQTGRLSNIGKILNDQAHFQEALSYYQQALRIDEELGDKRHMAIVLGNMGSAYLNLGDFQSALDLIARAVSMEGSINDAPTAGHHALLGLIYGQLHRSAESAASYDKALQMHGALGNKLGQAVTLLDYGNSLRGAGDLPKAREMLARAGELAKAIGNRRTEGLALIGLSQTLNSMKEPDSALETGRRALELLTVVGDSAGVARALMELGRATRTKGNLRESFQYTTQALEMHDAGRGIAGADQTRAAYFAARQEDYQFMIDLLLEMHSKEPAAGHDAAALAISERARARSLLDQFAESGAGIAEGLDPALQARRKAISDDLNAKGARLFTATPGSAQAEALRQEIRELERADLELQVEIRRTSPKYAELTQPQPLTAERIRNEVLDTDSLLLEFSLGAERSVLWAVSKDGLRTWSLPSRDLIETQVADVTNLLVARSTTPRMETAAEAKTRIAAADAKLAAAARALSKSLIGPAQPLIRNKRLIIVPDGALQRLPFSMLPEPGGTDPLIVAHEMVVLPSASALHVLRAQMAGRRPAPMTFAVFADPVFERSDPRATGSGRSGGTGKVSRVLEHGTEAVPGAAFTMKMPRLPFTAREADQILRIAPGTSNLKAVSFNASRALATSGVLNQYRYVHFATHGYLDTEHPGLSALVLSQLDKEGKPQDGFLRVADIYNMRLAAELVVLSACQTGLGKEVRGEGLLGLTRAFLYAGAPRLIVSLWNVNDHATADLMAALYRGMLREGKTPAAALRSAQLALRRDKRWESPYYWAAFVEQGEWK